MTKIKKIKDVCDSFDRDFDDPAKFLDKIAKIAGSKNRILEEDEDEDEEEE